MFVLIMPHKFKMSVEDQKIRFKRGGGVDKDAHSTNNSKDLNNFKNSGMVKLARFSHVYSARKIPLKNILASLHWIAFFSQFLDFWG